MGTHRNKDTLREAIDHWPRTATRCAASRRTRPIRIEGDYEAAFGDEARRWPIDATDSVEAIKFRMEQGGLTAKDLEPLIGSASRVHEVLNRERSLTLAMIRRLHKSLAIAAEALIAEGRRRRGA